MGPGPKSTFGDSKRAGGYVPPARFSLAPTLR